MNLSKKQIYITAFIFIVATIAGLYGLFQDNTNSLNQIDNTKSDVSGFYYATIDQTEFNKREFPTAREYTIFWESVSDDQKDEIMTLNISDNNHLVDSYFIPSSESLILHRYKQVEIIDLKTQEKTLIHEEGVKTTNPDGDEQRDCTSIVTGVAPTGDGSKIIVSTKAGLSFRCKGEEMLVYEKQGDEYIKEKNIDLSHLDRHEKEVSWVNGNFSKDTNKILSQFAGCNKGPCPPTFTIFNTQTRQWGHSASFLNQNGSLSRTDLISTEPEHKQKVVLIDRREDLQRCDPPIEATAPAGEVITTYNVKTEDSNTVIADSASTGYNALGFTADGNYALIRKLNHKIENGCIADKENNGYSILAFDAGEILSIEDINKWTTDNNKFIAYRAPNHYSGGLYINGEEVAGKDSLFLGFSK